MNSVNWCFTLNNPTKTVQEYYEPTAMKYYVAQLEIGENGTNHVQGYLILHKKTRLAGMKKLIPAAHWEPRKGTHDQARLYCMKDDTRVSDTLPWEGGIKPKPGTRTDLNEFKEAVKRGCPFDTLIEEHSSIAMKYPSFLNRYTKMVKRQKVLSSNCYAVTYEERWQQELRACLQLPPVMRRIHWVYSKTSETGKTSTMKSFMHEFDILPSQSWKKADILHGYTGQKIIWFNIPRKIELNATMWQVLEELSDGGVQFSPKYDSQLVVVDAHIVVTTNHTPKAAQEALPKRIKVYHAQLGDCKDTNLAFEDEYGPWPTAGQGECRFDK